MPSEFDTDFGEAFELFEEVFGATVAYHRGDDSVSLTAQRSATEHKIIDEEGLETIVRGFAFRLTAADLVISEATITPRQGDRIKETIGSTTHVFEVQTPDDSDCYQWADPNKTEWYIYTSFVGTE